MLGGEFFDVVALARRNGGLCTYCRVVSDEVHKQWRSCVGCMQLMWEQHTADGPLPILVGHAGGMRGFPARGVPGWRSRLHQGVDALLSAGVQWFLDYMVEISEPDPDQSVREEDFQDLEEVRDADLSELFGDASVGTIYSLLQLAPAAASFAVTVGVASTVYAAHTPPHAPPLCAKTVGMKDGKCFGAACYRATFITCAALCAFGALLALVLARRMRSFYAAALAVQ